ncbi:MAG: PIN domain-containing protein [Pedosphaera sp.]|nr:PIN domain-containing protein [Pedosphaera sp.]
MPASGEIKLADANVWLALAFSDHVHHATARDWFDGQGNGVCAFCRITQMALLRHLTNSAIMGRFVLSQRAAWENFDKFAADPRVTFLSEPAAVAVQFRALTESESPSNERWTDAYLAAFASVTGAELVTFDQGFRKFGLTNLAVLAK